MDASAFFCRKFPVMGDILKIVYLVNILVPNLKRFGGFPSGPLLRKAPERQVALLPLRETTQHSSPCGGDREKFEMYKGTMFAVGSTKQGS